QAGLARCQREVEEVTELMKQNLNRAMERDGRLSDLDSRAQELRAMVGTYRDIGSWGGQRSPGGHYRHIQSWRVGW
ncbi:VAMP5 protein, partial [Anhinga anhinga]|nr:VAMP5 protein [Anhinga anhinga]